MSALILVVDDEPDVEELFRQHFRKDLRASRFVDGVRAIRAGGAGPGRRRARPPSSS